jgi:phytoene dehydrogenase-like protein
VGRNGNGYDAVVIGGGIAGLTCALGLLTRGRKVLVLEKEPKTGGCQAHFTRKGFIFESCLHSVAETYEGGPVFRALEAVGLEERPEFERLDPSFRFIFPDKTYAVPPRAEDYRTMLAGEFPREAEGIGRIFGTMDRIYEGLGCLPRVTPAIVEYGEKVFQQVLDEGIRDRRLAAVISGFWGYLGLPPSRTSALVLSAFNASICNHGNYFPKLGIMGILGPLERRVREAGGEILLRSPVRRIVVRDGRACGVVLEDGREIRGEAIVSSADANATFFGMVGEEHLPGGLAESLRRLRPTLSAFSVYLGVKGALPNGLSVANLVYPGDDMDAQHEAILRGEVEKMPYALSVPTLVNPSAAPRGCHILSLFMPMPCRLPGAGSWKERKREYTERFIGLASRVVPGLEGMIVVKEAATPDTLVRYTGNSGGAVGGWDYTPEDLAGRPGNRTPVEGLWLAGHWTVPGVGIHGVIQSGCLTASMIP